LKQPWIEAYLPKILLLYSMFIKPVYSFSGNCSIPILALTLLLTPVIAEESRHTDFPSLPLENLQVLVGHQPPADVEMANRLLAGQGIKSSFVKAISHLVCAADKQNTRAMFRLSRLLMEGDGQENIAPDKEAAVQWLKRGAKLGDADCIRDFELRRDSAKATFPTDLELIGWLESGARAGRTDSMWRLSECYRFGVSGVEEDVAKSQALDKRISEILKPRAEQGDYDAMLTLSRYNGQSEHQQWSKAMIPILEARAAVGNSNAMAELANNAWYGYGREKNLKDRDKWVAARIAALEEGCGNGSVRAMCELGELYLWGSGSGVPVNTDKGLHFLTMAAECGDEHGALQLCSGLDLAGEPEKAAEWLLRTAMAGSGHAMNSLAIAYEKGRGVSRDYVAAYCWYSFGQEVRPNSNDHIKRLEEKMTSEQVGEAQSLTRVLRQRIKWQKKLQPDETEGPKKPTSSA
jgi:TPR repeat protein